MRGGCGWWWWWWWDGVGVDDALADPGGDGVRVLVVDEVWDLAKEDVHEEGVRVGTAEDVEVVVEVGGEGGCEGHRWCWIWIWIWIWSCHWVGDCSSCGWRSGDAVRSGVVDGVVNDA